ncbi:MAG TPA: hypothetical protein VL068_03370 [Microthrixaceae bacterium]|nr:hypothetical protein [Microthrixaceae bacterium]
MQYERGYTRDRLPPVLRARLGRAFYLAAALLILGGAIAAIDISESRGYGIVGSGEHEVSGRVKEVDGELKVSYRHPLTHQDVVVPLWIDSLPEPKSGDTAEIIVGDDPLDVELKGDSYLSMAEDPYFYVAVLALAAAVLLGASWRVLAIRRLVRARSTPRSMMAVVSTESLWRRRAAVLNLYEMSAPAGALPVCSVPLATFGDIGIGQKFRVDVVGTPRPRRRVAARTSTSLLWPRRRALSKRHSLHPVPDSPMVEAGARRPAGTPGRPPSMRSTLERLRNPILATAAASVLFAVGTVGTVIGSAESKQFASTATVKIAEVTGYDEDEIMVRLKILDSDRRVEIEAPFIDPMPPIGMQYQVLVAPGPGKGGKLEDAQFVAFPYDAVEPIVWASIPLVVALVWLAVTVAVIRRVRRVARHGPHFEQPALILGGAKGAIALVLDERGIPIGSVPLDLHLDYSATSDVTEGQYSLITAGTFGPSSPVAVWTSPSEPALQSRPMRAATPSEVSMASFTAGTTPLGKRVELDHPWLQRRPPELWVYPDRVDVVALAYFGEERWSIPIDGLAVVDLRSGGLQDGQVDDPFLDDDIVFERPMSLPDLNTKPKGGEATLGLLFATPQRIPPVRWMMFENGIGVRKSRSKDGLMVDGIGLMIKHP